MKCPNFLCLLFHLVSALDYSEYSRSAFKKLGKGSYAEYNDEENTTYFGAMKILEFSDKKAIYVGGRNAIYKFNVATLELEGKTSDDLPLWKPYYDRYLPMGRSQKSFFGKKTIGVPLDGCFSTDEKKYLKNYYDYIRRKVDSWNFVTRNVNGNETLIAPLPSSRYDLPVYRTTEKLEKFICEGSFIRGLEKVRDPLKNDSFVLWACGTFGGFPQAYLFDPSNLELIGNGSVDTNLPSCARWPDEPMVTKVAETGDLYIGSGWGLYRPDKKKPDVPKNNSTMLYSDWRMLKTGQAWFSRMAMVLGRDVTFIPFAQENHNYLYFFGREVSPQYSYINSLTSEITQSFMLRICKNDVGYRYTADEDLPNIRKTRSPMYNYSEYLGADTVRDPTVTSFTSEAYDDVYHVPTKHFVSAKKFPFGCFMKRYDGAQSLNRFWGEENIIYFNRVVDVNMSFDWVDERLYRVQSQRMWNWQYYQPQNNEFGADPNLYVWQRMYGAFSSPGFRRDRRKLHKSRSSSAHGAVCQFQIFEWKTDDLLIKDRNPPKGTKIHFDMKEVKDLRKLLPKNLRQFFHSFFMRRGRLGNLYDPPSEKEKKMISIRTMMQEFMALFGVEKSDFYSRFSTWFHGGHASGFEGVDFQAVTNFTDAETPVWSALKAGQCLKETATQSLTKEEFLKRMKLATTAWPTEWDTWVSKTFDAVFHMNPVNVAGGNVSFVVEGVEFAKMFVMKNNLSDYRNGTETSPLVYMVLVTTDAEVYRVVMCDLVSIPGDYITCEMFNTDQPYVMKTFNDFRSFYGRRLDLEKIIENVTKRMRVSSLLSVWRLTSAADEKIYPHDTDSQSPLLKDAVYEEKSERLILTTPRRIMSVNLSALSICSSYLACVHCASDPLCVWKGNTDGKCEEYRGKSNQDGIQDVLHRGAACQDLIKPHEENVAWKQRDMVVVLNCSMADLYRGIISWSVDGVSVDMRNSLHRRLYQIAELRNSLVLLSKASPPLDQQLTVKCIGRSIDDDSSMTLATYTVRAVSNDISAACTRLNLMHENVRRTSYCMSNNGCYGDTTTTLAP